MSPSSAEVTYRPTGAGHRARTARVDLTRIPDPEAWLINRLGPLASFDIRHIDCTDDDTPDPAEAERLDSLSSRLTTSMQGVLAVRSAALKALVARLEGVTPPGRQHFATSHPTQEERT